VAIDTVFDTASLAIFFASPALHAFAESSGYVAHTLCHGFSFLVSFCGVSISMAYFVWQVDVYFRRAARSENVSRSQPKISTQDSKGKVRRHNQTQPLVGPTDYLEEQLGRRPGERHIPKLIQDQDVLTLE